MKLNPDLVSICIPVYNGELYLRECLDSACVQDYLSIEIVIVDDGSSDNSIAIINEYLQKDKRIKLFVNPTNLGLVGNWNECIKQASGEWIKFLFQDDTLTKNCVSRMMNFATNDISLISCNRTFVFENNVEEAIKQEYQNEITSPGSVFGFEKPTFLAPTIFCKMAIKMNTTNFIGEPNVILFRKNITTQIGLFDSMLYQICDYEYWLRIACNEGLFYIPEPLATFRVHTNSTSATNRSAKLNLLDGGLLLYKLLNSVEYKALRELLSFKDYLKFKIILKLRLYEAKLWIDKSGENKFLAKYNKTINEFPKLEKYAKLNLSSIVFYQLLLLRRKINSVFSTNKKAN